MKKKSDPGAFIARNWYFYVLWIVVVVFAWEGIFQFLTKYKDEESVYCFFGAERVTTDAVSGDFNALKPEYVKNVDITARSSRTEGFELLFSTDGVRHGDLFVLPEAFCDESTMRSYFYPMDPSVVKEVFGEGADTGIAVAGDKVYGIKVYDKETDTAIASEYFDYTYTDSDGAKRAVGDYYLFFGKKSLHLGKISGSEADGAIVFAQAILGKGASLVK